MSHIPVLLHELIHDTDVRPGQVVVDATLGGGGHAREMLSKMSGGIFIGLDQDAEAIARNAKLKDEFSDVTIHLVQANFRDIAGVCEQLNIGSVDRIIADLGYSSFQIDDASRGMSFRFPEAALDMRMDISTGITAAEILNTWDENIIADMLYAYGDESRSRALADAIVAQRKHKPFVFVSDLISVVSSVLDPKGIRQKKTGINPATKTFQALRIAVNDEYGVLKQFLTHGMRLLSKEGRMAVITFHSGEDRIVKQQFGSWVSSREGVLLHKKATAPTRQEILANPRARSAHLRTFIRS